MPSEKTEPVNTLCCDYCRHCEGWDYDSNDGIYHIRCMASLPRCYTRDEINNDLRVCKGLMENFLGTSAMDTVCPMFEKRTQPVRIVRTRLDWFKYREVQGAKE